jgi:regulator of protease activity HflC (stomatin/prohibitin superfamily)
MKPEDWYFVILSIIAVLLFAALPFIVPSETWHEALRAWSF